MLKVYCLIPLLLILNGCAKQKFDCPYTDGVRCKSLSEVDKAVSSGFLENNQSTKAKEAKKLTFTPVPDSPLRTSEEVLSLWIAPYQTEEGTYHEASRLHFVVRPAEWGAPLETGVLE